MKSGLGMAVAMLSFAVGLQGGTITYTWNFASPTSTLGTSATYTSTNNGGAPNITITAYGLGGCWREPGCSGADLYGKNGGAGEQGLGIRNDPSGDHEIYPGTFVQLDLTSLFNTIWPVSGSITIDSVQKGEYFTFWMSSRHGNPGNLLYQGTTSGRSTVVTLGGTDPGLALGSDRFFSVGAMGGNVLLSAISANVNTPEPASFALVGVSLLGVGIMRKKRRDSNRT